MCGRYSLEARPDEIAEAFALSEAIAVPARFNIAPTQSVPIVRLDAATSGRRLEMMRWGIPSHPGNPRPLINARSETVDRKPSFRSAFRQRRCLVPATGFFEWQKLAGAKQPFHIRRHDRRLFAFAGIWEPGREIQDGDAFAVLTTAPNQTVKSIHDRMPVILDPAAYLTWLDPAEQSSQRLLELLVPAPDDSLTAYPISTRVNRTQNDDPACVEPLASPPQESLFPTG
jgi:putative SOS response-associated peptidase YedK